MDEQWSPRGTHAEARGTQKGQKQFCCPFIHPTSSVIFSCHIQIRAELTNSESRFSYQLNIIVVSSLLGLPGASWQSYNATHFVNQSYNKLVK